MNLKVWLLNGTFKKWIKIPLICFLIFLCMNYPFKIPFGYDFDLRQIPFILGCLYGGYTTGLILLLTIFILHSLLHLNLFLNPFVLLLIFIFIPYMAGSYKKLTIKRKIIFSATIGIGSGLITFLTAVPLYYIFDQIGFMLKYVLIQGFALGLTIFMIEHFRVDKMKIKFVAKQVNAHHE